MVVQLVARCSALSICRSFSLEFRQLEQSGSENETRANTKYVMRLQIWPWGVLGQAAQSANQLATHSRSWLANTCITEAHEKAHVFGLLQYKRSMRLHGVGWILARADADLDDRLIAAVAMPLNAEA